MFDRATGEHLRLSGSTKSDYGSMLFLYQISVYQRPRSQGSPRGLRDHLHSKAIALFLLHIIYLRSRLVSHATAQ